MPLELLEECSCTIDPIRETFHFRKFYFMLLAAVLLSGIMFYTNLAMLSFAQATFTKEFNIKEKEYDKYFVISNFAIIPLILFTLPLADDLGRIKSMLIYICVLVAGLVLLIVSKSMTMFMVGSILSRSMAITLHVADILFICEMTRNGLRNMTVMLLVTFEFVGFIVFVKLNNSNYKVMYLVSIGVALGSGGLRWMLQESYCWLDRMERPDEAVAAINAISMSQQDGFETIWANIEELKKSKQVDIEFDFEAEGNENQFKFKRSKKFNQIGNFLQNKLLNLNKNLSQTTANLNLPATINAQSENKETEKKEEVSEDEYNRMPFYLMKIMHMFSPSANPYIYKFLLVMFAFMLIKVSELLLYHKLDPAMDDLKIISSKDQELLTMYSFVIGAGLMLLSVLLSKFLNPSMTIVTVYSLYFTVVMLVVFSNTKGKDSPSKLYVFCAVVVNVGHKVVEGFSLILSMNTAFSHYRATTLSLLVGAQMLTGTLSITFYDKLMDMDTRSSLMCINFASIGVISLIGVFYQVYGKIGNKEIREEKIVE